MRKLILLFTAMLLGTTGVFASSINEDKVATSNAYSVNDSFIFIENGITFSVYPDGEFDFYIENQVNGTRNGITFNSGYDYNPYTQYDDYGAVIQVENVPIYYDYYGRVNQIGEVDINYVNNRVRNVGGMSVYYNNRGFYDYHTGYINIYNRNYVYQPFHRWFARPAINLCLVYNRPYRRYYSPVRYTYYNTYVNNYRDTYYAIGKQHRYNNMRQERASIYRNDKRVAVRDNSYRSNRSVAKRDSGLRTGRTVASNNTARTNRTSSVNRSSTVKRNSANVGRSNRGSSVTNREVSRSTGTIGTIKRGNNSAVRRDQGRTSTKREVVSTPRSTTVKRSATTYKKPIARSSTSRGTTTRTQKAPSVERTQRSSTARSTNTAPTRSRSTVSTSSRSVNKSPSRSTRSRSASTRDNRRN